MSISPGSNFPIARQIRAMLGLTIDFVSDDKCIIPTVCDALVNTFEPGGKIWSCR